MSGHVVIVGGGVIGLCSAYYARVAGFDVTVIERNSEGAASCSTGNAGMIVPSHFVPLAAPGMIGMGIRMLMNKKSPFGFKMPPTIDQILWAWKFSRACTSSNVKATEAVLRDLNLSSRREYEILTDKLGIGYQLEKLGLFALCKTQHALDEEALTAMRANEIGVRTEIISREQVMERDPGVEFDVIGAAHFLDDAHLTPQAFLKALNSWLVQNGVQFIYGEAPNGFGIQEGLVRSVRLTDHEVEGDQLVLAAGVWSSDVSKSLGLKLPMMAGKGYSMNIADPPVMPKVCSLLVDARVAVTPMQSGLRVAGTMEIGTPDSKINLDRVSGIIQSVQRFYPQLVPSCMEGLPVWHGHRPCSPDGMPFLGRLKHLKNVTVATGHSMMGLSLGPISGKLVSEILIGQSSSIPLELMDPHRYA